jgi:hypothetical protein
VLDEATDGGHAGSCATAALQWYLSLPNFVRA